MTAPANPGRLERRYRRLLHAYPADYRAERGDEIVGVLLDCARPDRTRPTIAESADLVRAGLTARVRQRVPYARSAWPDAMAVLAVLLPVVLGARVLQFIYLNYEMRRVLESRSTIDGSWYVHSVLDGWQGAAGWALVAILVIVGRPRIALVGAIVATAFEAIHIVDVYHPPTSVVTGLIPYLVVEVVAVALLASKARVRRGLDLVGRRGLALAGAAAMGVWFISVAIDLDPSWLSPDVRSRIGSGSGLTSLVTVLAVTALVALGADRAVGARIALSGLALGSIMIATHLIETNSVRYGPFARDRLIVESVVAIVAPLLVLATAWLGLRILRAIVPRARRA